MGILDKLFGRNKRAATVTRTREEIQADCPHTTLLARWDSVEDMGKNDKATKFICDSCHAEFSPNQTDTIREGHAERLRVSLAEEAREDARIEQEARDAEETSPSA